MHHLTLSTYRGYQNVHTHLCTSLDPLEIAPLIVADYGVGHIIWRVVRPHTGCLVNVSSFYRNSRKIRYSVARVEAFRSRSAYNVRLVIDFSLLFENVTQNGR